MYCPMCDRNQNTGKHCQECGCALMLEKPLPYIGIGIDIARYRVTCIIEKEFRNVDHVQEAIRHSAFDEDGQFDDARIEKLESIATIEKYPYICGNCQNTVSEHTKGLCQGCGKQEWTERKKMSNSWSVAEAENIAREVHKNQKRWDGSPYIEHPKAVAKLTCLAYKDDSKIIELECIAWLHDTIEDSPDPQKVETQLRRQFSAEIVNAVKAMSRPKNWDYFDFIMNLIQNPLATKVKIVDISHNLYTLKKGSMKDKYLLARFILEQYRDGFLRVMPPIP